MSSQSVALEEITWFRPARQRRELTDIEDLAKSMSEIGQLQPIIITREFTGVAGERRWNAAKALGWTHVEATFRDELDELTLFRIELEENIKRVDLPWQDRTLAIAQYHELCKANDPNWTEEDTANEMGYTKQAINKHLTVHREMGSPRVADADTMSTALKRARAIVERRRDADPIHIINPVVDRYQVLNADFRTWASTYTGLKFNFIHCDFPYGINADQHKGMNAATEVGYSDDPADYFQLMKTLAVELDRFCEPSAHMIFWFSPTHYCATWELLKLLDGFRWEEHPLIWIRGGNEGVAPDPTRRPRRVYDMAFFGWRGDRKTVGLKANAFVAPTERERHPHEKSELALEHFFGLVVDEHTTLLDPTCGSGSALRAARSLGARRCLGLEIDEFYASVARKAL